MDVAFHPDNSISQVTERTLVRATPAPMPVGKRVQGRSVTKQRTDRQER
jgi:hypothetical protein